MRADRVVWARGLAMYALPLGIFAFLVPQAMATAWLFDDWLALELLLLALLAIVSYLVALAASMSWGKPRQLALVGLRRVLFHGLWIVYFASYLGLCANLGYVPLLQYMQHGGDAGVMRADFYKVEGLPWALFAYVQSIFNKGFVPFAIVAVFATVRSVRAFLWLAIVSVVLISAFEKALIAWAYIPLLFYFVIVRRYRAFMLALLMFGSFFAFVSLASLASDLKLSSSSAPVAELHRQANERASYQGAEVRRRLVGTPSVSLASLADEPTYQFMLYDLRNPSPATYLLNRLVWIPFVTAYDTLLYWRLNDGAMAHFSTNRHLSRLFDLNFANLEKRVFMFQFKSGEETTGNANAFYVAEAYVAFGFAGVILFSVLIGMIFGLIIKTGVLPFVAAVPIAALGLISVSLISTLFSGGLLLMLLLTFLFTRRRPAVHRADAPRYTSVAMPHRPGA
ncbi:hypothetical protein ANDO1_2744 [plant metagenome]|uniref:Uncharacterized protein n=1 Tax=plant metagenome TaxID=1297885 RepID=A0A484NZ77_9ZZZZ